MVDLTNDTFTKNLGQLTKDDRVLSASIISSINQVFYADGIDSAVSNAINLSVRNVTADDFYKVVTSEGGHSFEPSTLYIVSSDQINAYNTPIVNVGDPVSATDAANKQYVDRACESVMTAIVDGPIDEISTAIENSLSSYAVCIGDHAEVATSSTSTPALRSVAIGLSANATNIAYSNAQAVAVGANSIATGEVAVAIGSQAEATGNGSSSGGLNVAIGYRAKAEGKKSIVIGSANGGESSSDTDTFAYAKRDGAIAIGNNAKAYSQYDTVVGISAVGAGSSDTGSTAGTAFGAMAEANGGASLAIGYAAKASSQQSIAIGRNAAASGLRAIAIGGGQKQTLPDDQTEASANYAIAIGFSAKANGVRSIAIGGTGQSNANDPVAKAQADGSVQIGIGENNVVSSLQFYDYQLLDSNGKIPVERMTLLSNHYVNHDGDTNIGPLSLSAGLSVESSALFSSNVNIENDIYASKHALVGKDVDFAEGGPETFAIGHEHHFYGKESFAAGNEGNVVGAKGFYWKAIDTTNNRIYLTRNRQSRYPGHDDVTKATEGSTSYWYTKNHSYDRPYFGPLSGSALSTGDDSLFTSEDGINLAISDVKSGDKLIVEGLSGKYITIWNCKYDEYIRCFKVKNVLSGSIIEYDDLSTINQDDYHTFFREQARRTDKPYTDNQYVVYFPEMNQAKISCNPGSYVTSTTFGAAAIGESNTALGYNSFAAGFSNRAESHYAMAFGNQNKAQGLNTFAAGANTTVRSNYAFGWSGNGSYVVAGDNRNRTFNINPAGGINGFYIGQDNFIQCVLSAIELMSDDQIRALKSRLDNVS